jgi:hypothetical protein
MGATSGRLAGQAPSDRPALKPYWGKPAVRYFRGGDGNVGIIRSPVRAIALPDLSHVKVGSGSRNPTNYLQNADKSLTEFVTTASLHSCDTPLLARKLNRRNHNGSPHFALV